MTVDTTPLGSVDVTVDVNCSGAVDVCSPCEFVVVKNTGLDSVVLRVIGEDILLR